MILVKRTLNRMTSLEGKWSMQIYLFYFSPQKLTTGCLKSENYYHFLIYNFFMPIISQEPQNLLNFTLYDVSVTS